MCRYLLLSPSLCLHPPSHPPPHALARTHPLTRSHGRQGIITAAQLLVPEPVTCGSAPPTLLYLMRSELLRRLAPVRLAGAGAGEARDATGAEKAVLEKVESLTPNERGDDRRGGERQDRESRQACHVVVIRREKGLPRGIANVQEFEFAVAGEAERYGCTIAKHLGDGPLLDQLLTFSNASVVVGAHGAGLSNLLVLPPRSLVLELMPMMPQVNLCYMDLAVKLGLRYSFVPHPDAHMEGKEFEANVAQVQRQLQLFPPVGGRPRWETRAVWLGQLGRQRGIEAATREEEEDEEALWQVLYADLHDYGRKHGRFPHKVEADTSPALKELSKWTRAQLIAHSGGRLRLARRQKLEAIGFLEGTESFYLARLQAAKPKKLEIADWPWAVGRVAPGARGQPDAGRRRAVRGRTVIMAAAIGYTLADFRRFIIPLRKVYDGSVVLFSSPRGAALELCRAQGVQLRELPEESSIGVRANRFVGYDQVCAGYDWCLAVDFRDVLFQSDPFQLLPGGQYELILTQEFSAIRIRDCPHNRKWLGSCWGYDWVESVGHESIICSGTIMGTPLGFQMLRTAMLAEMAVSASKGEACTARDQGHLNYIYLTHKLDHSVVLLEQQGRGIFNTVGYITPKSDIVKHLNKQGLVANYDGVVSPVIHQYDRFPELRPLVETLTRSTS